MKEIIQNKINEVSNSFPSLFSKEDVIKVLTELNEQLESEPKSGFDFESFKENFLGTFVRRLNNENSSDLVDFDSAEMSMNYNNQVEIDNIDVYVDKIKEIAEKAFDRCASED